MDLEATRFAVEIALAALATPFAIVIWFLLRKLISDVDQIKHSQASALAELKKDHTVDIAKLEKAITDHQLHVATIYVQKDDFGKFSEAVFKKLDRIEDFAREHIVQGRKLPNG